MTTPKKKPAKLKKPIGRPKGAKDKKPRKRAGAEAADHLKDTRYKPGESGNPAGRPKGTPNSVRSHMRALLKRTPPEEIMAKLESLRLTPEAPEYAGLIAACAIKGAVGSGKLALEWAKYISAQTDEPLKQTTELTGAGGEPLGGGRPHIPISQLTPEERAQMLAIHAAHAKRQGDKTDD